MTYYIESAFSKCLQNKIVYTKNLDFYRYEQMRWICKVISELLQLNIKYFFYFFYLKGL